jgi:peptidoglycan hydrolase CwlO-like protein
VFYNCYNKDMRLKPRILVDLQKIEISPFVSRPSRINLGNFRIIRIPLVRISKVLTLLAVVSYLVFGSVLAPIDSQHSFAAQNEEERQALEKQLAEVEAQIRQYQNTVDQYRSQGKSLESEIARLNAQINKLNLQIKSINLSLKKLDNEIDVNQKEIVFTENEIDRNKLVLARSLQSIYINENLSLAEIFLTNPSLAAFFASVSNLMYVQESLREILYKVQKLYMDLLNNKEQLALKKADAETLKAYQLAQKMAIDQTKKEKDSVLKITKGQESKYQELLKQTQKTAAQIRSRLFELLGGGELTFEEAYKFAKFAQDSTGVRAALVLAVLDRESALGQNVGRCAYQKAMHPTRDIPIFLALVSSLGINPDSVTVSCPNQDGVYGGAMGPAQFIPSTWNLYSARVADITGSNPASPWRNSDAFVATALYLKDALNACSNYSDLAKERCAAARYYAGARWSRYLWTYGDRVVTQAEKFQKDIDILNS